MKRFELVFAIAMMWLGSEIGWEIGIGNWGLIIGTVVYVAVAEIATRFFKKFGIRIVVEGKKDE